MRFWEKSLRIFKGLCDNATQSIRDLAQQTGLSKNSVHRLKQAMARRGKHPESWLWETEEGRAWLTRLVVATLYTFGLTRGVGVETLSAFFVQLRLDTQVGCSPGALRQVMQALEATLVTTAETWERDVTATGEVREIIGGVDETFLERMMLVLQDLPTGYLVLEDIADDRTLGIRVRRDIWVSVRYAEALNSATSSVTLQSTDRHGILGQKPTDFQVSV